jgi:hypothetical protein
VCFFFFVFKCGISVFSSVVLHMGFLLLGGRKRVACDGVMFVWGIFWGCAYGDWWWFMHDDYDTH